MSSPKFKKGDVVILKSGGVEMTIEDIIEYTSDFFSKEKKRLEEPTYKVVWYDDEEKEYKRNSFSESLLEHS